MGYKPGSNPNSGASKGGNVEKPPFGTKVPAVLAAYYPAGTHEVEEYITRKKKMQDKIVLVWELDLPDSKGRPFRVFEVQTESFYASSSLKKRVEAILARPMTEEEQNGDFDMDAALGKCGMLVMTADETKVKGPYVDRVDELQDQSVRVAVRHEYDVLPRYVKTVLASAQDGTVPGQFGAIIDGEVFFGNLPSKDEEKPKEDEEQAPREPGDESEQAPF